MLFATEGPISLRLALRVAVFVVCGYAAVQLTGRFNDGPGQSATVAPPTPKSGADDPLNRGILIEGGTFLSGSDNWDAVVAPGSPFSRDDEYPRRWTVTSFRMHEHEVTNEEYRRFDPGRTPVNDDSRMLRGGSFVFQAFFLRSAKRVKYFYSGFEWDDIGFRVVWPWEEGKD